MPFGYGIWTFLKNNPVVAYIAAGFAALATFLSWQRLRDMRIRREAKEKVIEQIEEQTDEAIERVEQQRERTADLNDAERLRLAAGSPDNRGRLRRSETD